jgi:hypothetical protein
VRKWVATAIGILAFTAGIAASGCSGDSEADDVSTFRAAFKETYGSPHPKQWYDLVTGMKMDDAAGWERTLRITTTLHPTESNLVARGICGAATKLALDLGVLGDEFDFVSVVGSDGMRLGNCG